MSRLSTPIGSWQCLLRCNRDLDGVANATGPSYLSAKTSLPLESFRGQDGPILMTIYPCFELTHPLFR